MREDGEAPVPVATEPALGLAVGLRPDQEAAAAALYWEAFRGKLGPVLNPEDKALRYLRAVLDPTHAIAATAGDGALLGVAGFKSERGAFVDGTMADLRAVYGVLGGLWRAAALSVLERPLAPETLLMDGICVDAAARGRGVGSALLDAVKAEARRRGRRSIRLDVIDTNPRARALYERHGFTPTETADFGPLRHVFGFRRATTMICQVA